MKKGIFTSILVITLALTIPISSSQAVSVGDSFVYVVKKAHGEFSYSEGTAVTVSGETNKFRVGDTGVAVNSNLDIDVTVVGSSSVNFDISSNDTVLKSASNNWLSFGLGLIAASMYPFLMMGISTGGTTDPLDISKGVSLGDQWYIAPPSTDWDNLYDFYNDTANWAPFFAGFSNDEGTFNISSSATWYDDNETLALALVGLGTYSVSAEVTSLTIIHNVRFDYNVTSYTLQGYNMNTGISGTYQGEDTKFNMVVQVAESSYTRGLGVPYIAFAFGALFSIGLIVVIKKRRK
ncbi:MAG TPA: choice-of-anchor S family protein [candidate division Zixibacteria bacterium]|nr:choice-of-anchor S family protein [candidate division Zixibacteria bacterium]